MNQKEVLMIKMQDAQVSIVLGVGKHHIVWRGTIEEITKGLFRRVFVVAFQNIFYIKMN
jgi:hypothetical protein